MDDVPYRSTMPSPKTQRQESERARRNQGFKDALAGRMRRVQGDPVYGQGYRRGAEKRVAEQAA